MPSIPGYEVRRVIGAGGFGTVFEARQASVDRLVALKVLSGGTLDTGTEHRFRAECRAVGGLSWHPHVVSLFDAGVTDQGAPYLVMELVPGGSVAEELRTADSVLLGAVVRVGVEVADALAAAHAAGVLHRDVKPDNILIGRRGEYLLTDFGIATIQDATRSQTGNFAGTFAYCAPEILAGERASESSDVYALGATLFTLLCGVPPFVRTSDASPAATVARIMKGDVAPLPPSVPPELAAVVERAMAHDPGARIPTASATLDALRSLHVVPDAAVARPPASRPGVATGEVTVHRVATEPPEADATVHRVPTPAAAVSEVPVAEVSVAGAATGAAPAPALPEAVIGAAAAAAAAEAASGGGGREGRRRRRLVEASLAGAAVMVLLAGGLWAAFGPNDAKGAGAVPTTVGGDRTPFTPRPIAGGEVIWSGESAGDIVAAAKGGGAIWIGTGSGTVIEVSTSDGTPTYIDAQDVKALTGLAYADGSLWLADLNGVVRKVDRATGRTIASRKLDAVELRGIAASSDAIWAIDVNGLLTGLYPDTLEVFYKGALSQQAELREVGDLTVDGRTVWTSAQDQKAGVLVARYGASFDPDGHWTGVYIPGRHRLDPTCGTVGSAWDSASARIWLAGTEPGLRDQIVTCNRTTGAVLGKRDVADVGAIGALVHDGASLWIVGRSSSQTSVARVDASYLEAS